MKKNIYTLCVVLNLAFIACTPPSPEKVANEPKHNFTYSVLTYNQIDYQNNVLSERIGEHVSKMENLTQANFQKGKFYSIRTKQQLIINHTKETLNNLTSSMKRLLRSTKTGFIFDTIVGGPNVLTLMLGSTGLDAMLTFKEGEICLNHLEMLANNITHIVYLNDNTPSYLGTYTRPSTYSDFEEMDLTGVDKAKREQTLFLLKTLLVPKEYEDGSSFSFTLFSNQTALTIMENLNLLKNRVLLACENSLTELEKEAEL